MRIAAIGELWMVVAVTVSTARETGAARRQKRDWLGNVGYGVWNLGATTGFLAYPCPAQAALPCKQAIGWATVCDAPFPDLWSRGQWYNFDHCWQWHWQHKGSKIPECKSNRNPWANTPYHYYPNPYYTYTGDYFAARGWPHDRIDCPGYITPVPEGCTNDIPVAQRAHCPPEPYVPPPDWRRYYEKPQVVQQQKQPQPGTPQQPPATQQSSRQKPSAPDMSPQLMASMGDLSRRVKVSGGPAGNRPWSGDDAVQVARGPGRGAPGSRPTGGGTSTGGVA